MTSEKPPTPANDDLPSIKPDELSANGHLSQIPGLSPSLKALSHDRLVGRRAGVLASDSEYVKLAKQGGHKGLLCHEVTSSTSTPRLYKAPDWFCPIGESSGNSSLITGEHKSSPRAFPRREPPFGSDNMSAWERDDGNACTENIPSDGEMEKQQSQTDGRSKFRKTVFDKKPAPVNMSTLLSFGYMGDSKPTA